MALPFPRPSPSFSASLALLFVRVVAGLAFMHHGWSKVHDPLGWMGASSTMPGFLQALAAFSEFGGGLAWILGLLVPVASLGLLCTMGVALSRHLGNGDAFVGKGHTYELALVYAAIATLLLVIGPGRHSLDALLFRRGGPGHGETPSS